MIAANKRLLKATLTEGVLNIQSNLIDLYATNLQTLGTQAALIASFAFAFVVSEGISSDENGLKRRNDEGEWLPNVYYVLFTICVISSFFTLSQCTIVTMFGPSKALKGQTTDAVKDAADSMRHQIFFILRIAGVAVTSMFGGTLFFAVAHLPYPVAIPTIFCLVVGYYLIYSHGKSTYALFALENDITKVHQRPAGNATAPHCITWICLE